MKKTTVKTIEETKRTNINFIYSAQKLYIKYKKLKTNITESRILDIRGRKKDCKD